MKTDDRESTGVSTTRRVWIALVSPPFILAAFFAPVIVYLSKAKALEGDALMRAVEPLAPIPVSIAFVLILILTLRLARRDGCTWAQIGWVRPQLRDVLVGVAAGVALVVVNHFAILPLLVSVRPGFDPTISALGFAAAGVTLTISVIGEDTLYRGYALHVLSTRYGRVWAVLITSLFYCILAPGQGWPLNLYALYLGVALCLVRFWTGSLVAVVVAHLLVGLGPKVIDWVARMPQ